MEFLSRYKFERVSDKIQGFKNYGVIDTDIKNVNFRTVIEEFCNENFLDNTLKYIESLCSQINFLYSQRLGIKPAIVQYLPWSFSAHLSTFNDSNYIQIGKEFYNDAKDNKVRNIKKNQVGLFYLYSILHETYHTYQNYNLHKYFNNEKCDERVVDTELQSLLANFDNSGYLLKEQKVLYCTDLMEFDANVYAITKIMDLIDYGYIDKKFGDDFLKLQVEFYLENFLTKENIDFTKNVMAENLEKFKEILNFNDDDISISNIKSLKQMEQKLESIDFDKMYSGALKKVEELKIDASINDVKENV